MDFTQEFFKRNRRNLFAKLSNEGVLVLSANGLVQRSSDTTFEFRQDSNFWYLTGLEQPDYILVVTDIEEFIIQPPRAEHRDLWDGALDIEQEKNISGITEFMDHIAGWNKLDRLIKKYKKIYTITPAERYIETFGFYTNPARSSLLDALKKHRSAELVDIRKDLARQRQIKQPDEITAIKKAISITGKSLTGVLKKLNKYKYEYELVADITASFISQGANGHAYSPIVASGKNASTIHYVKVDGAIESGEMILFDVGAEYKNYSADISRTYSVGSPSKRQQEVFDAVRRTRDFAFSILKPGIVLRAYEKQVDAFMAKQLKKLKLLNDIENKKILKKYYPHLTSHYLGLDVHDSADYEMPLSPGMVLTVEPGIYIAEELIGIRLEDDVLITESGIEILSKDIPSSLVVQ